MVIAISIAIAVPLILSNSLLLDLWASLLVFATVAISLNLVTGLAGQVSLGHAALMGVGAYTAGVLVTRYGVAGPSTFFAAAAVGALVGAVFGIPSLRLRGQYLALVTIGAGFIFVRLVTESEFLGGQQGIVDISYLRMLGRTLEVKGQALVCALLFGAALLISWKITHSRLGRHLAALKDSEVGTEMLGVDTIRLKIGVFILSSTIAAMAGAAYAHLEGFIAGDLFGLELSLLLLLSCLVGGLGRPFGAPIGAIFLAGPFVVVPGISRYQLLIVGPIALITLFLMPDGVAGWIRRKRGKYGLGSMDDVGAITTDTPLKFGKGQDWSVLTVSGISKEFGGVHALQDVSTDVRTGSIHALIGPNGSGKTTLIDVITGVTLADRGAISIDGADVTGMHPNAVFRLGVSRTFQSVVQFPSLSILESAVLGAREKDVRTSAGLAVQLMDLLKVGADPRGAADALSYGQAKRLEIARALVARPRLLILDEPAAGMDPVEILELGELLTHLKSLGLTVLIADHHMDFVLGVADTVTVLESGRVVATGTAAEVRSAPEVIRAYLGSP